MRRIILMAVTLIALAAFGISTALADGQTDPETLHIGTGTGTSCQAGGCFVYGQDVNGLGGSVTTVDVWQNQGGKTELANPILLIIGIPNATSGAPGTITLGTGPGQGTGMLGNGGTSIYGWNGNGDAGSWTTGDVYDFLGLNPSGSASENFGNWTAAESAVNNISATSFGIFVYTLTPIPSLGGSSGFDVNFNTALPQGTFVLAYGCSSTTTNDGTTPTECDGVGNTYSTPFTQTGLVDGGNTPVPEPGSLMLLGTGLIGLGGLVRRKFRV